MDTIERLASLFERFPGIGPRQARRFVQYLLRSSPALRKEIADEILQLGRNIRQCESCRRFFGGTSATCTICSNTNRDETLLLVVAADADIDRIEQAASYNGYYFVLGGTVSLGANEQQVPNEKQFVSFIKTRTSNLEEIIFGLPANPEGDATQEHARQLALPFVKDTNIKTSTLGRGLSTGAELEYADTETIKSALKNRQ